MKKFSFSLFQLSLMVGSAFVFSQPSIARDTLQEVHKSQGLFIEPGHQWSDTLWELSVSGDKSADGKHGVSYEGMKAPDGIGSGADGHNGRDAGDGERTEPGNNAGKGTFTFGLDKTTPGLLTLSLYMMSDSGKIEMDGRRVFIDERGFIRTVAQGGQAGMPGHGGWGENAGHGARGRNGVSKGQSGGPGGDGGNGGDPGRGWSGPQGGNGGELINRIPIENLEIAWVIDPSVKGGQGGAYSFHGKPGKGGRGGSGGSGATWTETESYTDSKGNRQTRTTFHKAPDGPSGSDGYSGKTITTPVSDGEAGRLGISEWQIYGENGETISTHKDRMRLNLMGFTMVDFNHGEKADGIFEPGERGEIRQIFIQNNGDMPTPKGAKTRIKVASGAYYVTNEMEIALPEGLQPGEIVLLKDADGNELKIPFQIKDYTYEGFKAGPLFTGPKETPFIRSEMIAPRGMADVAQITRTIPEFHDMEGSMRKLNVTFPILIEPISSPPSLARGEAGRFILRITNISGQDFGGESEIRRQLKYFIKREGGDLSSEMLEFYDLKGNPIHLNDGLVSEIANLKANQSKTIEFAAGLSPAAESYRSAGTKVELDIDRFNKKDGEGLMKVQRRVQLLSVADDYFKTPNSEFLLVTNHGMSRQAYVAWKHFAEEKMKTDIDIWDLSYKNFISFMQKLSEHGQVSDQNSEYARFQTSLAQDFAGKTIILLANDFSDTAGLNENEVKNVWDYVNLPDLRRAMDKYNINIRIIGSNSYKRVVTDIVTPYDVEGRRVEYASLKEMKDAIEGKGALRSVDIEGAPYFEVGFKAPVTRRRFFTKPKASYLEKIANNLYDYVMGEGPGESPSVVHKFNGKLLKRHGVLFNIAWFGKTYEEGSLEIWRSSGGNIVASQVDAWSVNNADYILSRQNIVETLISQGVENNFNKLETFIGQYSRLSAEQKAMIPLLTEAIMKELVLEQVSLRAKIAHLPLFEGGLQEEMPKFNEILKKRFHVSRKAPPEVQRAVMNMLLNLQVYSWGQTHWWEKWLLLGQTRNSKISSITRKLARDLMLQWFGDEFSKKEIVNMLDNALTMKKRFLKGRMKLAKSQGNKLSWSQVSLDRVDVKHVLESDIRFGGVFSGDQFAEVQARLKKEDARVQKAVVQSQDRGKGMKVANPMVEFGLQRAEKAIRCRSLFAN